MECTFQVGDQVVYVGGKQDITKRTDYHKVTWPVAGRIYTVRDIELGWNSEVGHAPAIRLVEIRNPKLRYKSGPTTADEREIRFMACTFKPVKKTDISVFTALLNTTSIKELIDG